MPCVTIQSENKLRETVDKPAHTLQASKPAPIHKAVKDRSRQREAQAHRESWMQASLACRAESMRINEEFSEIEGDENFDSTY